MYVYIYTHTHTHTIKSPGRCLINFTFLRNDPALSPKATLMLHIPTNSASMTSSLRPIKCVACILMGNYGSFNENGPHWLVYLNTWFPVGGTVWLGLEGVTFLEEMCHWGQALRFQKTHIIPRMPLCLLSVGS